MGGWLGWGWSGWAFSFFKKQIVIYSAATSKLKQNRVNGPLSRHAKADIEFPRSDTTGSGSTNSPDAARTAAAAVKSLGIFLFILLLNVWLFIGLEVPSLKVMIGFLFGTMRSSAALSNIRS